MNTADYIIVGTCSNCGGPVGFERVTWTWGYGGMPHKRCLRCGATPKEAWGPVIPMNAPVPRAVPQPLENIPLR